MVIEFGCHCGKKLQAAAEHAGKSARCSQCGQIVMISAATAEDAESVGRETAMSGVAASSDLDDLFSSELPQAQSVAIASTLRSPQAATAEAVAAIRRQCPNCQSPLNAAAVLCIHCGYNLKSRTKMTTVSASELGTPEARPQSRFYRFLVSRLTSWKLWSGLGMMAVAGIGLLCFAQGDFFPIRSGRAFAALFALFVTGGFTFVNGLCDGDEA